MHPSSNTGGHDYRLPLAILTSLFFMWGFITSLNDILIPHLKAVFSLNYFQAMAVNLAFFGAYALVSYPAGALVKRIGYQNGIVTGLAIAATGCVIFASAADIQRYAVFLIALFVLASGITVLQVAANPYVTKLGEPSTASSRLTMTQAFNSLGTTVAPSFGAILILSVAAVSSAELALMTDVELAQYNIERAQAVKLPYYMLASVLAMLAVIFKLIHLPTIVSELTETRADNDSIWKHKHLVLGVVAIFVYVGAEVAIGSFLVNFIMDPAIGNMEEAEAAHYVTWYWGGAMVGRFIGAAVMFKVAANRVLIFNSVGATCAVIFTIMLDGQAAMISILIVGLFNSIMFPTIFSLAIQRLGALSSQGSGLLCVAIVGGALIPLIQGALADQIGIQMAFFIPALCYLYIAWYGAKGHRPA
ncbi:sugar MFS transporter [Aestuariibacter sp. AA17]|uniref:Sugar MFS transporter n=2 Tax=Fluctibacter corallii TaxID=2984329 RepID=A0ABT3A7G9_9ALTE|nr:sugar MFS transporter [Aestuariibacter sp. AA17]MCV2884522.1 sugar MFS transporter [Aestuariibacter sp. AA17]